MSERLALYPENARGTICAAAAELLPAGARGSVDCRLVSAGRLRRRFAQRAHAAASASHVGCSAFAAARLAGCSAAARTAGMDTQAGAGSAPAPCRAAPPRTLANFAARSMAGDELDLPRLHVPAAYDFALTHRHWHDFEHVCFLASSLAFWWCVVRPWPTQQRRNEWGLVLYLLSADLVNTAISAFLRVLRLAGLSLLPRAAQSLSRLAALRSGSGSGRHVGGWLVRFPGSSGLDYVYALARAFHARGVSS